MNERVSNKQSPCRKVQGDCLLLILEVEREDKKLLTRLVIP